MPRRSSSSGPLELPCRRRGRRRPLGDGAGSLLLSTAIRPPSSRSRESPGTNGKTTTAFLLRGTCSSGGVQDRPARDGEAVVGGARRRSSGRRPRRSTSSAPSPDARRRRPACAMEVSSHALVLAAGTRSVRVKVFTNLTQDHLDFHSDMEDYFAAKRSLFIHRREAAAGRQSSTSTTPMARARGRARQRARETRSGSRAASEDADFRAERPTSTRRARISLHRTATPGRVEIPLPGHFNVENALAALAAAASLGVLARARPAALARADRAPGRLEPFRRGSGRSPCWSTTRTRRTRSRTSSARPRRLDVEGAADLRLRRGRRPRPGQAAADGRDRRRQRRCAGAHLRQPALEDPAGDHRRRSSRGSSAARPVGWRSSRIAARRSRSRSCWRAGRLRRDRGQGARAGTGVRGRAQGALRRP